MTPIQNAIITSVSFIVLYWFVMSGGTTFSGDWLPPPLLMKLIWGLQDLKRDGKTDQ